MVTIDNKPADYGLYKTPVKITIEKEFEEYQNIILSLIRLIGYCDKDFESHDDIVNVCNLLEYMIETK